MFGKKKDSKGNNASVQAPSELNPVLKVLKRWRVSIVLVIVMIIVVNICFHIVQSQNTAYATAQGQLSSLQNQEKMNQVTGNKKKASAVQEASGLDTSRQKTDDGIAEKFFENCLDWDDSKSYDEKREWVSEQEKATPSIEVEDSFLTVFFPAVTETEDDNGKQVNIIDKEGLNVSFDSSSFESHVVDIDTKGDVYSYLAEFNVTTTSRYEDAEGTSHSADGNAKIAATYSIDSDGNMKDVNAYTIVE